MGEGSIKFVIGAAVGAAGGFAAGSFAGSPTGRSTGKIVLRGMGVSARFLGRTLIQTADGVSTLFEAGYTRIRGRETYLEREIEDLRKQITRLEHRGE